MKAIQTRKGSREAYARVEQNGGWRTEIDDNLAAFLGARPTASISRPPRPTASPISSIAAGRRVSSRCSTSNTLAFADYGGNRQYITQGNLSENPKAHIFLMDYAHRRRVKIWGEARVVEDDPR